MTSGAKKRRRERRWLPARTRSSEVGSADIVGRDGTMPRRRHPSPTRRAHRSPLAPRARARAGDRAARRGQLRRRRAGLPPRRRRLRGGRGPPPPRRRQRARRAGPDSGGARPAARGGALPAPARWPSWRGTARAIPTSPGWSIRARTALAGIDRVLGAYAAADRGYQPRWPPSAAASAPAIATLRRAQRSRRAAQGAGPLRRRDRLLPARAAARPAQRPRRARDAGAQPGRHRARARQLRPRRATRPPLGPAAHRAARRRLTRRSPPTSRRWPRSSTPAAGCPRRRRSTAAPWPCSPARWAPRSLEVGLNLASLAAVEQRRGRPDPRPRPLRAALAIQERLLGRDHADVAMTVNNLAVLERDAGRLDRSAALFRRAHGSFRRALGDRHPHTVLRTRRPQIEPAAVGRPNASRIVPGPADDLGAGCATTSSSSRFGRHGCDRGGTRQADVGIAGGTDRRASTTHARRRGTPPARATSTPAGGLCSPAASTRTST